MKTNEFKDFKEELKKTPYKNLLISNKLLYRSFNALLNDCIEWNYNCLKTYGSIEELKKYASAYSNYLKNENLQGLLTSAKLFLQKKFNEDDILEIKFYR